MGRQYALYWLLGPAQLGGRIVVHTTRIVRIVRTVLVVFMEHMLFVLNSPAKPPDQPS